MVSNQDNQNKQTISPSNLSGKKRGRTTLEILPTFKRTRSTFTTTTTYGECFQGQTSIRKRVLEENENELVSEAKRGRIGDGNDALESSTNAEQVQEEKNLEFTNLEISEIDSEDFENEYSDADDLPSEHDFSDNDSDPDEEEEEEEEEDEYSDLDDLPSEPDYEDNNCEFEEEVNEDDADEDDDESSICLEEEDDLMNKNGVVLHGRVYRHGLDFFEDKQIVRRLNFSNENAKGSPLYTKNVQKDIPDSLLIVRGRHYRHGLSFFQDEVVRQLDFSDSDATQSDSEQSDGCLELDLEIAYVYGQLKKRASPRRDSQ
jgi:hypothetical protein